MYEEKSVKKFLFFVSILIFGFTNSFAAWSVTDKNDEMTGEKSSYAMSSPVSSTKTMDFPYANTQATLVVGCSEKSVWNYIYFTSSPNLVGDSNSDGYSTLRTRIKWDNKVKEVRLTQKWGSKTLQLPESEIDNILNSKSMLIELPWHGNGDVYFKFDLSGSNASIKEAYKNCGYLSTFNASVKAKKAAALEAKAIEKNFSNGYYIITNNPYDCSAKGGKFQLKKSLGNTICVFDETTFSKVKAAETKTQEEKPEKKITETTELKGRDCAAQGGHYVFDRESYSTICVIDKKNIIEGKATPEADGYILSDDPYACSAKGGKYLLSQKIGNTICVLDVSKLDELK